MLTDHPVIVALRRYAPTRHDPASGVRLVLATHIDRALRSPWRTLAILTVAAAALLGAGYLLGKD